MPPSITLTFALTEPELSTVLRNQIWKRVFNSWLQRIIFGWITLVVILADVGTLVGLIIGRPLVGEPTAVIIVLSIIVGFFWLYSFFPVFFIRRVIDKKTFDQQIWQFTDADIQLALPHASARYEYNHLQRVEEDQKFFTLYFAKYSSTPIPKRGFASAAEETQFRDLIKSKVPNTIK